MRRIKSVLCLFVCNSAIVFMDFVGQEAVWDAQDYTYYKKFKKLKAEFESELNL